MSSEAATVKIILGVLCHKHFCFPLQILSQETTGFVTTKNERKVLKHITVAFAMQEILLKISKFGTGGRFKIFFEVKCCSGHLKLFSIYSLALNHYRLLSYPLLYFLHTFPFVKLLGLHSEIRRSAFTGEKTKYQ